MTDHKIRQKTNHNNSRIKTFFEILVYVSPVIVFIIAMRTGSLDLGFKGIADAVLSRMTGNGIFGTDLADSAKTVIVDVRLPRVLLSLLVGAGLSVSGASFQSIMRNPLVEPYTLGVSSAAAFGAALSMVVPFIPIQGSAFGFAMLSVVFCYLIAGRKGQVSVISLILAGIIISSVFTALLSIIQVIVDPLKLQGLIFWTMGGFYTTTWAKLLGALPLFAAGFIVVFILRWKLNILSLGDKEAKMLGVNPALFKAVILFASTLLASASVATAGIISLTGLMIPHICRMLFGPDNKRLIPLSMTFGASYLTVVDIFARSIFTFEIPVGIFTTFAGAPFFIILLKKVRGAGWN